MSRFFFLFFMKCSGTEVFKTVVNPVATTSEAILSIVFCFFGFFFLKDFSIKIFY